MSSQCGQVVYPAFFESSNFMRKGYLQLYAFPGFLHMDGMRFHSLKDECSNADRKNLAPGLIYPHATLEDEQRYRCPATFVSPRPAYAPDASLCWTISVHDTCLEGRLCLGSFYRAIYEGWKLIQAMCCLLLTTPCEHEPDSPAGDLAQHFCLNKTPSKNTARLLLVTVGRDYRRQLAEFYNCAAFGFRVGNNRKRVVVHAEGCIRCALKLCLDSGATTVIS